MLIIKLNLIKFTQVFEKNTLDITLETVSYENTKFKKLIHQNN